MAYIYVEKHHNWDGKYTDMEQSLKLLDKIRAKDELPTAPDVQVGHFGVIGSDGIEHVVAWKVSGVRKDRRHGYVDQPVPHNRHTKELLDSMFKGWD